MAKRTSHCSQPRGGMEHSSLGVQSHLGGAYFSVFGRTHRDESQHVPPKEEMDRIYIQLWETDGKICPETHGQRSLALATASYVAKYGS